jgi:hypothetical protein
LIGAILTNKCTEVTLFIVGERGIVAFAHTKYVISYSGGLAYFGKVLALDLLLDTRKKW